MNPVRCLPLLLAAPALVAAPAVKAFRLPNGLRVQFQEDHERPLVRMEFRVDWDGAVVPPGREALPEFLARVMDASGVEGMDREAFRRSMEDGALRYAFRSGPGSFAWSMVATSQGLEVAFRHLALAVMRPALTESAMEAQRQAWDREAGARSGRDRARIQFLRALGDPRGYLLPDGGLVLSAEAMDSLRRTLVRPERAILTLCGDINQDQARQASLLHFGAWGPATPQSAVPPPAVQPQIRGDAQKDVQKEVRTWMTLDSGSRAGVEIWAGGPQGGSEILRDLATRLLRRELGCGPAQWRCEPGLIQARFPIGTAGAEAARGFRQTLAMLTDRVWTAADVEWAMGDRRAQSAALALHPQALAESLGRGGGLDGPAESPSLAEVQKALRAWMDPASMRWMVLGAGAEDRPLLEQSGWGPVRIVE